VVFLGLWQLLATVPVFGRILLPPFFFSNPVDVGSQIVDWFSSGVIWKHLMNHAGESILAFAIGSLAGVLVGSGSRASRGGGDLRSLCEDGQRVAAGGAGADLHAMARARHLSKVALGVTLVFFIVFFNVYQGVKEVSSTVLANAACSA